MENAGFSASQCRTAPHGQDILKSYITDKRTGKAVNKQRDPAPITFCCLNRYGNKVSANIHTGNGSLCVFLLLGKTLSTDLFFIVISAKGNSKNNENESDC